jgi:hypothetical protein
MTCHLQQSIVSHQKNKQQKYYNLIIFMLKFFFRGVSNLKILKMTNNIDYC